MGPQVISVYPAEVQYPSEIWRRGILDEAFPLLIKPEPKLGAMKIRALIEDLLNGKKSKKEGATQLEGLLLRQIPLKWSSIYQKIRCPAKPRSNRQ